MNSSLQFQTELKRKNSKNKMQMEWCLHQQQLKTLQRSCSCQSTHLLLFCLKKKPCVPSQVNTKSQVNTHGAYQVTQKHPEEVPSSASFSSPVRPGNQTAQVDDDSVGQRVSHNPSTPTSPHIHALAEESSLLMLLCFQCT